MAIKPECNRNINRLKDLRTQPFRSLLYLEWILLGMAILGELPSEAIWGGYDVQPRILFSFPLFSLLCLLGLGLMGLKLPKNNSFYKWSYTIVEIGLIWLPIALKQQSFPFITPCLIIVLRNCLIFESQQCLLATGLVFLSFAPSTFVPLEEIKEIQSELSNFQSITLDRVRTIMNVVSTSYLILYGLALAFVLMLVNAILKEYESRQQLAIAHEQLRQYAILVEDRATLQERNRIAREIHDSVGHVLTAQTIQLNNAIAFWQKEPDRAYQFLTAAKQSVTNALNEIRHSVSTLRNDPLEGKNLADAIALLFQEFSARTKVFPDYTIALNHSFSEEIKLTVYRIIQEALTNIIKHSKADAVKVELQTFPEHLYLSIQDNGRGFNPDRNTTGFGLQGMRERVTALKGKIEIDSNLNRGCTIVINIPLENQIYFK
jgi:signal transduction histidine kinase